MTWERLTRGIYRSRDGKRIVSRSPRFRDWVLEVRGVVGLYSFPTLRAAKFGVGGKRLAGMRL